MPAKRKIRVSVARLTFDGKYQYPWHTIEYGEAEFTTSSATCYFEGRKFSKDKGNAYGGNYLGSEDGDSYRIAKKS